MTCSRCVLSALPRFASISLALLLVLAGHAQPVLALVDGPNAPPTKTGTLDADTPTGLEDKDVKHAGDRKSSDPVLSVGPGKSIIGRTLRPGTYRVVPELGPGQNEASVSVTLVAGGSAKPVAADKPATGEVAEPVATDIPPSKPKTDHQADSSDPEPSHSPQAKTQPQPAQDPQPDVSSETGPEYDCEYGLPRRDGGHGELELTPGDLPAGFRLDDLANFNKACVINQWIMHGPDRKNRIELSISAWNPRSEKYYEWKHGMLGTGEFEHSDISVGTKQLYVEQKGGCNKQLIMQVGNYLVEMHRPIMEGLTQQTDPISRAKFVAVAKACEARIATVAGIPDKDMLNDNPSDFRWGTSVWPVSFVNGTLKVQGAGKFKWGTDWVVVDTGIQSYRGQGTGAGPVVTYTKDGKSWTVILLNYATGGKNNQRNFKYRIDIRSVEQYGATLRVAGRCYDYSWNHLKDIDCGSGNFIDIGTTETPENNDPNITPDNETPGDDVTSTTPVTTQTTGQTVGPGTAPLVLTLPALPPEPGSVQTPAVDVSIPVPPPKDVYRWWPGISVFKAGTVTKVGVRDSATWQDVPSLWALSAESSGIGHFEGNDFHAENPGYGWMLAVYDSQAYDKETGKPIPNRTINCRTAKQCRVIPADQPDPPPELWSTSPDELLFGRVYVMKKGVREYVNGVRISLSRVDGRNLETESKIGKNQAGQNEEGHYGFTGIELGRLPEGIYSIRCYKQTGTVSTDLWHKNEYRVKFPFKPGDKFVQDIELSTAGKQWPVSNLGELDKVLNQ